MIDQDIISNNESIENKTHPKNIPDNATLYFPKDDVYLRRMPGGIWMGAKIGSGWSQYKPTKKTNPVYSIRGQKMSEDWYIAPTSTTDIEKYNNRHTSKSMREANIKRRKLEDIIERKKERDDFYYIP